MTGGRSEEEIAPQVTTRAGPRGEVVVEPVPVDRSAEWEDFVRTREDTCFVDDWRWRDVVWDSYRLPSTWFLAKRDGKVAGALGLTLTRHPVFGTYLATAPFGSYGGFYHESDDVALALLRSAEKLREEVGARHVNVRGLPAGSLEIPGWRRDRSYATYWLDLPGSAEEYVEDQLPKKVRWLVRKATGGALRFALGSTELLDDFLFVMERSMKELGSPYHGRTYLVGILERFGSGAVLGVAYNGDGAPVGANLLMLHGSSATQVHANALQDHRSLLPAEFLYYSAIQTCCDLGLDRLDLGRSLIGSGNEQFKMKWRPRRLELDYWYHLSRPDAPLPALNQGNPRLKYAIRTWQHLPLWLLRRIGPRLIKGIL